MTEQEKATVHQVLEAYLLNEGHVLAGLRPFANEHRIVPILPDWSGFVGLDENGQTFWVSTEGEPLRPVADPYVSHLARIRGADLVPELSFLKPRVSPEWVACETCHGNGRPIYRGQPMPGNVVCQCGGLGKLPPELSELLRERAKSAAG